MTAIIPPNCSDNGRQQSKAAIYLSAFAFPGAGQLLQRRWLSAILHSVVFLGCFFIIIFRVVNLWLNMLASVIDNRPIDPVHYSQLIWPFGISMIVYASGLIDTIIAFRKERHIIAMKKLDEALKNISTAVLVFVLTFPVATTAQLEDLIDAVRANDVAGIDVLVEKFGFSIVQMSDSEGTTPLHVAAALNLPEPTAFLISAGADVNARTTGGFTPLHWAASKNASATAKLLITIGADINAKATSGITPLHWAAGNNSTNTLSMLIASGADIESKTDNGFTPLHWAIIHKSADAARWLAFKIASDRVEKEINNESVTGHDQNTTTETRVVDDEPIEPVTFQQPSVMAESGGKTLSVPLGLNERLQFVWIESLKIWAGKHEITNGQFKRFRSSHSSMFRETFKLNTPEQPVVYISWNDAKSFCNWLNRLHAAFIPANTLFRLPTDKEWTALARCGTSRTYPWGDEWPPKYGNFSDLAARKELPDWSGIRGYDDGHPVSCPVTSSGTNEWNIYGLAGNVWEWCEDWFDSSKRYKIRRGGSWDFDDRRSLRIDYRGFDRPNAKDDTVGFRVVIATK